jgi:hypothetical protein
VIQSRRLPGSFDGVKKTLAVVASLALIVILWMGAANTASARHEATRPVTRGVTDATEVLRVQTVQVDPFEIDTHDGGVWGQPQSDSDGT